MGAAQLKLCLRLHLAAREYRQSDQDLRSVWSVEYKEVAEQDLDQILELATCWLLVLILRRPIRV